MAITLTALAGCGRDGNASQTLPNARTTAQDLIAPCLENTGVGFVTEPGASFRRVGVRVAESPMAIATFHQTHQHAEADVKRHAALHAQLVGDRTELDFMEDPAAGDGGTAAVMVLGCVARATDRVEGKS
jgi:hypothetical protein